MIKFDYSKLLEVSSKHGLSKSELKPFHNKIKALKQKIVERKLGFHEIVDDQKTLQKVLDFAKQVKGKYENIVVLGIGGSALGMICLQQSLSHLFLPNKPRLFVLDNIDPVLIQEFEETANLKKTLFLVITKSGGTPETLAQYLYFKKKIEGLKLSWEKHFVFVTDPEKGLLRKLANENKKITTFEIPQNVGGRFSVLTPVGLLPAALIGLDVAALLKGAKAMKKKFWSENFEENFAFQLAVIQYLLYQKKKFISVNYAYSQKLIRLSNWYIQLLGESIGKAVNNKGKKINVGITPMHATGATDQHSQNQLFNEGPNDKLFIFLDEAKSPVDQKIPDEPFFREELGYLKGVTMAKLFKTEMQGTIDALAANDRPIVKITLAKIDETNLGEIFMLLEGSIAYLGELFEINAFDQPGVELSKNLTRKYLAK